MEISTDAIRFKIWLDFPLANVDMVITPKLSILAGSVEAQAGNHKTPTEKSVYRFLHIAGGENYEGCESIATSEFMMGRCYIEFETEEVARLPEIIESTKKRVGELAKKYVRYHEPHDLVRNSRVGAFSRT